MADPSREPAAVVKAYLESKGWNDRGRDCWAKYEGTDPSLVLRWLANADITQLKRVRHEARELIYALDAVLAQSPQQGRLIS